MTLTPCVRRFTPQDQPGVVALWQLVFPDEPEWNESNALIRTKLTVQPELFFVCEWDNRLVGTVIAGFDGVRGWVHKVACHPDAQRNGVARLLMEAAESALAALGCNKLNLQVRAGNHSALAFYQAAGYQIEDRISLGKHLVAPTDLQPERAI
ncbi:MAG: GNAT family acetyltransferase [Pseudomonadota bacterium]